jgi:hypothetical protein
MTTVAQTARLIRKDLKAQYPHIKFSVRSENYSGGDSVNVKYNMTIDAPSEDEVESLLSQYKAGSFNGMIDLYERDPNAGEFTTKYLMIQADFDDLRAEYKQKFLDYYQLEEFDDALCQKRLGNWADYSLVKFIRGYILKQKQYAYAFS